MFIKANPTCYASNMPDKHFDRKTIEAQLNELSRHIHELVNKMETAVGREAEALRPKLKAAEERLRELKETSREAWGDLKPGLAKAWDELQTSLNQAASRFKNRPKE
jgi:Skp family chaperone for outer membrane proteins